MLFPISDDDKPDRHVGRVHEMPVVIADGEEHVSSRYLGVALSRPKWFA